MTQYLENDKSKAICQTCGLVSTTFEHRMLTVGQYSAACILTGVCDSCGTAVSIPAQETPAIKAALAQENIHRRYQQYKEDFDETP